MPAFIAAILAVLAGGLVLFGAPAAAILLAAAVWGSLLWLRSRFTDRPTARLS
jgi:hypothetical protein